MCTDTHPDNGRVLVTKLLTLEETAAILLKSPAQLRWMIHQGTAPVSAKIASRRVFRATDVADFIDSAFKTETTTN